MLIEQGIDPTDNNQKAQIAELYYDAFEQKFDFLFSAKEISTKEKGLILINQGLEANRALVCKNDDEIIGVAGLHYNGKSLLNFKAESVLSVYNIFEAILFFIKLLLFYRKSKKNELLLDGIVVKKEYRGQGIGTQLLYSIFEWAKNEGFHRVRLDVVDSNPSAKKLYEKLGFRESKVSDIALLSKLLGFQSVSMMIKDIEI